MSKDDIVEEWTRYVESYSPKTSKRYNLMSATHVVRKLILNARKDGYKQALDDNDILHVKEAEKFINNTIQRK